MAKLYTANASDLPSSSLQDLKPRKETVRFLLNYSQSLRIMESKGIPFECILN